MVRCSDPVFWTETRPGRTVTSLLPVPHILHKRNPLYPNICHLCQQSSYALHWTICPTAEPLLNIIKESLSTILSSSKLEISQPLTEELHTQILDLDSLQIHHFSNRPSIFSTLSGLVPLDIIQTLSEYILSHKTANTLSIQLLLHINKSIYTNIWIPYCIDRAQNHQISLQSSELVSTNLPISYNQSNNQEDNNSITQTSICKIETWLPKWIIHSTQPSDILYYSSI